MDIRGRRTWKDTEMHRPRLAGGMWGLGGYKGGTNDLLRATGYPHITTPPEAAQEAL